VTAPACAAGCRAPQVAWVSPSTLLGDLFDELVASGASILIVVLLTLLMRWSAHRLIDRLVRRTEMGHLAGVGAVFGQPDPAADGDDPAGARRMARARAMGSLMKSIVTVVLFTIMALMVIALLGLPIAPLLTSAGVLGVAFGIGAQNLVKDFLAGVFMILEDQYGVGDHVTLGETTGTVEAVGLRVTRIRDEEGTAWFVRNGEVIRVGNRSDRGIQVVVDLTVRTHQDLDRIRGLLEDLCRGLGDRADFRGMIVAPPVVLPGVTKRRGNAAFRIAAQSTRKEQWRVTRELREAARAHLQEQGVRVTQAPWLG
jgi:small-conductance mechanosensitive channel